MALWKRAVLALVLVLFAAVAIAPSAGSPRTIPNGVRIAGINVSGLDAGQARQQLSARFGAPLRFRFGKKRWSVEPERLGAEVGVDDAVRQALEADGGDDVNVGVEVDRAQVRRYVDGLEERFGFPAGSRGSSPVGRRSLNRSGVSRSGVGRWSSGSHACFARGSGRGSRS